VHSWVHPTANDVIVRFRIYFASWSVPLVVWTTLLIQLVRTG
jgi:hypothetical protein